MFNLWSVTGGWECKGHIAKTQMFNKKVPLSTPQSVSSCKCDGLIKFQVRLYHHKGSIKEKTKNKIISCQKTYYLGITLALISEEVNGSKNLREKLD